MGYLETSGRKGDRWAHPEPPHGGTPSLFLQSHRCPSLEASRRQAGYPGLDKIRLAGAPDPKQWLPESESVSGEPWVSVGSPSRQGVAQLVIPPPPRPASAQASARSAVGRGCLCGSLPLSFSHIETIRPGLTAACLTLSARDTELSSKPDLPSSRSPLGEGGRPAWPHLCSPGANFRTFYLCPLFCSPL